MFPLHMEELEIFGARPPVGSEVACQIKINKLERHRVGAQAQFVRADGTVWMRIKDWEDWRFHWPGRYRDSFRQPRDYLVGEELSLEGAPAGANAVWLEPPADMGRPVWRDVLEFTQLGPEERASGYPVEALSEAQALANAMGPHRSQGGGQAALERSWRPSGLSGRSDGRRRRTRPAPAERVGRPALDAPPAISIAHADGVAIALAVLDPTARVGLAVEPIVDRSSTFDRAAFTAEERALLDRWSGASRAEWVTRFWCAKQAAAKASAWGSASDPARVQVVKADEDTGVIHVLLDQDLVTPRPNASCDHTVSVISARRGDRAWAWTIGKGIKP